ncbi:MAG: DUF6494 family protein [Pseudazoarcus pumilus]|nr:DUF6494 family protein [Pseudazoarcus pumilus]
MSIRKFLKTVGVNSQLAIEKAVRDAAAEGRLPAGALPASMTLHIAGLALDVRFDGELRLE